MQKNIFFFVHQSSVFNNEGWKKCTPKREGGLKFSAAFHQSQKCFPLWYFFFVSCSVFLFRQLWFVFYSLCYRPYSLFCAGNSWNRPREYSSSYCGASGNFCNDLFTGLPSMFFVGLTGLLITKIQGIVSLWWLQDTGFSRVPRTKVKMISYSRPHWPVSRGGFWNIVFKNAVKWFRLKEPMDFVN